jgi:hypothetical protein
MKASVRRFKSLSIGLKELAILRDRSALHLKQLSWLLGPRTSAMVSTNGEGLAIRHH